jgi:hypothetical protein
MERIKADRIPHAYAIDETGEGVYVVKIDTHDGMVIAAMRFIHELLSANESVSQSRFIVK